MGYSFGDKSRERLAKVDSRLLALVEEAIQIVDFSVIQGHRTKDLQDKYYESKKSKVRWPNSKHNSTPSKAVDIAPYPIDWDDTARCYHLAGIMKALAYRHGVKLRWGGDWDSDNDFNDQTFNDLVHFEIDEK